MAFGVADMGSGMTSSVASRLASALLESGAELDRVSLLAAAPGVVEREAPLASREDVVDAIDLLVGLGPLERLLADPEVSDVLVNGPEEIYVDRAGILEKTDVAFADDGEIFAAAERAIAPLGLRLDRMSPAVDARMPDGSRLHALIPPASVDGPVLAVRRFTSAVRDLKGMVAGGSVTEEGAAFLASAVRGRLNIVVGGGTGAGKTTLLNVLSREIPSHERVVTIEDSAELQLHGHVVRLEARAANVDGAGEVRIRDLVRHALRLRPDRIIVGEVRGSEALDMITAMSTGHDGSMSTIHSNSVDETPIRLEMMATADGVSAEAVRRQVDSSVDVLVQMVRSPVGRKVESIVRMELGRVVESVPC